MVINPCFCQFNAGIGGCNIPTLQYEIGEAHCIAERNVTV